MLASFAFVLLAVGAVVDALPGIIPAAPLPTPVARRGFSLQERQNDYPPCFLPCFTLAAAHAGCTTSDFNCLCSSQQFLTETAVCFAGNCTDQQTLWGVQYGAAACLNVGITQSYGPSIESVLATKTTAGTSGALDAATSSGSSPSAAASTAANSAASRALVSLPTLARVLVAAAAVFSLLL